MKFKRTERIGAIVKILSDNPNKIFTLSHFTNQFNAAKSTISEDLLVVKNVFEKLELGKVITISGAAGGVKYIPKTSKAENEEFLLDLCQKISDPSRILSGGFLYLIDLIYNPTIVSKIGKIMASNIDYAEADYVVTMETKGIPMALMTAKAMNLPLVIIRKDIKVSEGPTLSMTYVSGNTSKVESMSLPRKALKPDSKVIIIDDFMRGGGTIKGMIDLMTEFGAEVVGTGVFISTTQPEEKMVKNYISLIELDVQGDKISVQPNLKTFKDEYKNDKIDNFDNVFDKFIQNTFVSKSNLQLDTYESQTKGEFFDNITKNISMITAQAIYNQLVEDVRKKSKEKVYPPISFRKLIDKKGIDISSIKNQIDSKIIKQNDIGGFYFFLIDKGISNEDVNRILDEKNQHDLKWQNMSMLKYQQIILVLKEVIDNNFERGIDQVYESCVKKLNDNKYEYKIQIDNLRKLVEVLYYEYEYSKR